MAIIRRRMTVAPRRIRLAATMVAAIITGTLLSAAPGVAKGAVPGGVSPAPLHTPGGPNDCRVTRSGVGTMCTITNDATGLVAEVFAHGMTEGSRTVIWPNYGGESEHFLALNAGPDKCYYTCADLFYLVAVHSGMCLTDDGRFNVFGRATVMRTCERLKFSQPGGGSLDLDAAQTWFLREIPMSPSDCPSGQCFSIPRFVLVNGFTDLCLDAGNPAFPAPPKQGAELATWPCLNQWSAPNAVNQNWRMKALVAGPGPWVRPTKIR